MKTKRQSKILELIADDAIETQEELLRRLCDSGYNVTQATVSRDIKELRLVKAAGANGKYRYVSPQPSTTDISSKFYTLFEDSVCSVENGMNIVCIKCYSGMAQAVCSALDTMHMSSVIGTIAGDDTIFVLCQNETHALALVSELKGMIAN